ncbi:FMN-dependent NADH-azoreductase 1 [compost metagenome]
MAGKTFRYTEQGPEGLAVGKRVVIVSTAGGQHAGQPSAAAHEDYLKFVLGFVGITDVQVVHAHGLAMGDAPRAQAIEQAQARIGELFEAAAA